MTRRGRVTVGPIVISRNEDSYRSEVILCLKKLYLFDNEVSLTSAVSEIALAKRIAE